MEQRVTVSSKEHNSKLRYDYHEPLHVKENQYI